MDLFDFQGKIYLVVDYYSRWLEIKRLHSQTSDYVINILKELFATHGIPEIVISDNGPQYASEALYMPQPSNLCHHERHSVYHHPFW
jgi:hypothetical protein